MKLNPGIALFVLGIGATIIGGAKAPLEGQTWPDTLPLFLGGTLLTIIGLVLWRKSDAALKAAESAGGPKDKDPVALLQALQTPLEALRGELESLDTTQITVRVDALLDEFILPMGEGRQRFIDRYGMDKGAEILVTLAYGERMINRVWSAAADGHLPEASASYIESADAFNEAVGLLPE